MMIFSTCYRHKKINVYEAYSSVAQHSKTFVYEYYVTLKLVFLLPHTACVHDVVCPRFAIIMYFLYTVTAKKSYQ